MRLFSVCVGTAVLAAPVLADELGVVESWNYATYDFATQQVTEGSARAGLVNIWDNTTPTGFFTNRPSNQWVVDWGDVGAASGNILITGFDIGYATNSTVPVDIEVGFYAPGNGFGDPSPLIASFLLTGLPGSSSGGIEGWVVTVDLKSSSIPFNLPLTDLDNDGLGDFEYSYNMANRGNATATGMGPLISGPVNAPGIADAFDRYDSGPQGTGTYAGTFFFGGSPFAQFHMRLYTIPEPATIGLLALGGLGLIRRR